MDHNLQARFVKRQAARNWARDQCLLVLTYAHQMLKLDKWHVLVPCPLPSCRSSFTARNCRFWARSASTCDTVSKRPKSQWLSMSTKCDKLISAKLHECVCMCLVCMLACSVRICKCHMHKRSKAFRSSPSYVRLSWTKACHCCVPRSARNIQLGPVRLAWWVHPSCGSPDYKKCAKDQDEPKVQSY